MSAGIFSTPRPLPSRMGATLAGGTVIGLALPIFAIAGWPLQAWALAAVLWVASEIFAAVLTRLPDSPDNLAAAGRCVFHRVVEQVRDRLRQPIPIPGHAYRFAEGCG